MTKHDQAGTHDQAASEAAEELRLLVEKAELLLESLRDDGGEITDELRMRVGETVQTARQRLGDMEQSARNATSLAAEAANDYVASNPWMAVAVAAGVGAVIGATLVRR